MGQVAAKSIPSVAEVTRIAAISDRVVRNLEITECYAQLSEALRARTGPAANWCTFATWASRQAGRTIRGEDFLARFRSRLGHGVHLFAPLQSLHRMLLRKGLFEPETMLGRVVAAIHTPFDAFERASDAVAQGNLKVFAEIGREFARFLAIVPVEARHDSDAVRAFSAELLPGPPPDGQDYLTEAFAHYQQHQHETDPAARASWILLANLKIGLHEQTRLQPQITAAVEAPVTTARDLGARVLGIVMPRANRWPRFLRRPAAGAMEWLATRLRNAATRLTREVVTDVLMVLTLPNVVLALGRNLEAPVPTVFGEVSHPPLDHFVKEYDPCAPGTSNCAAADWCDLRQRMHYIVHLFRAFAEHRSLFARPFTAEQVAQFRAGNVPDGVL